jgi:hypothetical protein
VHSTAQFRHRKENLKKSRNTIALSCIFAIIKKSKENLMMNKLIVSFENCRQAEDGAVALGERLFQGRGGSYLTYQVKLSASAAQLLEEGDVIRWWDKGGNDLPSVSCGGEIAKPNGSCIQLRGGRDVGIDSGHPPHLTLAMKTRKGVRWHRDSNGVSHKVIDDVETDEPLIL